MCSLVKRQDHLRALELIGILPEKTAFPTTVSCPICKQNALHLFEDILADDVWLFCNYCQIRGNIVSFAAEIWKSAPERVLARFVEAGLITAENAARNSDDFIKTYHRLQAFSTFWEIVAGQLWSHDDDVLACRLRELGLRHETKIGDGLIGVAHPNQIEKLCAATGQRKPKTLLTAKRPVIVFPYYDLPGRFSGVLLRLYEDNFTHKSAFISSNGRSSRSDAGYFLLNKLLLPASDIYRGRQFIVNDPEWVLTAHCFWGEKNTEILPIVADYDDDNGVKSMGRYWSALFPATRCFQSEKIKPHTISQACLAKGYTAIAPLWNKRTRKINSQYFLNRLAKFYAAANTWQKTLLQILTNISETAGYSFAVKLTIPHEKLQHFFDNAQQYFSSHFSFRVLENIKYAPTTKQKISNKLHVVVRDGKWWSTAGNLICNAQIIITRIVQIDHDERVYTGKIFTENKTLEFTASSRQLNKQGLLSFAAAHAASYGILVNFAQSWNARSLLAALQMNTPKIECIKTELGWDETANMFYLGNYALKADGSCTQIVSPQSGLIPASFKPIDIVPPAAVQNLFAATPKNNFVWAITSTIIANALAPVNRTSQQATALNNEDFEIGLQVGAALLCKHNETAAIRKTNNTIFLKKQIAAANWPFFVSNAFDDNLFSSAVNSCFNGPAFVRTHPDTAAIATGYGWQAVTGSSGSVQENELIALQKMVPQYIQHALKNKLSPFVNKNQNFVLNVMADLHDWLFKTYGDAFNLKGAKNCIKTPEEAHETLFSLIGSAIAAGELDVIPRPRRPDQQPNYLLARKNAWWVNRRAVDNVCKTRKNIYPNWIAIVKLLVKQDVFIEEETVNTLPGFVVKKSWCDNFFIINNNSDARFAG